MLYLLRHAKSSWDDPRLADFDRPLAPRGRKAAARMAAYMAQAGVRPDMILCSTSRRTRQTCEALHLSVDVRFEDQLYGASASELLYHLHVLPDDVDQVLLVGHNPGLQDLVVALAGEGETGDLERVREKFPTCALAALSSGSAWSDLRPGQARLEWFVTPRQLPQSDY